MTLKDKKYQVGTLKGNWYGEADVKQFVKDILNEINQIEYTTQTAEVRSKEIKEIIKKELGFEE